MDVNGQSLADLIEDALAEHIIREFGGEAEAHQLHPVQGGGGNPQGVDPEEDRNQACQKQGGFREAHRRMANSANGDQF